MFESETFPSDRHFNPATESEGNDAVNAATRRITLNFNRTVYGYRG